MIKIKHTNKVVLAYSGGLDTSAIIPWIKENYSLEVIAFVADVGQSKNDLDGISEKAIQSGASDCYIVDLKKDFVYDYIFPVLSTGALYEGNYLLGTAMARPIIAKEQIKLAHQTNSIAVCHGATGKGNDQVRFEMAYAALDPNLKVLSPWRKWKLSSREELIDYLKSKNISTTATKEKIYSRDENIWHISTEGGVLENTWNEPDNNCWVWTTDPMMAPDKAEYITIEFDKGYPITINNNSLNLVDCLIYLNKIGSKHGIGRIDIVENRLIGIKSRGCYETPGGTILVTAMRALEQLILDRDSFQWRQKLGLKMATVVYDGLWFSPIRKSIQNAAHVFFNMLSGKIVLKLYKGNIIVIKKYSQQSLYSEEFATFGKDTVYDQHDAQGFIKLFSLSSKIRAMKNKK
ncbi:argininosuccinate synthase [Buchnera aphidicola (Therioaphis trifolii)]|uniref:Argininosuccinate synthase n=1 Tax=Buchnera aphidicola (Therioaphis trifolii) TaxID=1241884 RepID=A0A4D6YMN9_9GAMM|nr:argininosuccinate synthase [Buchnera aphidicola]QCI27048.1 argininosuccinate synthase [Buchnera aphidicola (Therioaphis trifolii)]